MRHAAMHRRRATIVVVLLMNACRADDPTAPDTGPRQAAANTLAAPSEMAAVALRATEVELRWRDNTDRETGFELQRSAAPTGPFALVVIAPPDAQLFLDGGLPASSANCYRVRAVLRLARKTPVLSDFSNVACATTLDGRPRAPSGLNAVQHPAVTSYVSFTWVDNASDESGFRFESAPDTAGPWALLEVSGFPDNASAFHGLERRACYRLSAYNSFGSSGPSNMDCLTLPGAPDEIRAVTLGVSSIEVSWQDRSQYETAYELRRIVLNTSTAITIIVAPNATSWVDTGLASNVTYRYDLRARTADGVSDWSAPALATVSVAVPLAPAQLEVVPSSWINVGTAAFDLVWQQNEANTDSYAVERSLDGGTSWVRVAATGMLENYAHDESESLQRESTVCYRVFAVNAAGSSSPSAVHCTAWPEQPTITSWVDTGSTTEITWIDNSAVEAAYEVRVYALEWGYDVIAVLPANSTRWRSEFPMPRAQTYVVAVKDGGPGYSEGGPAW